MSRPLRVVIPAKAGIQAAVSKAKVYQVRQVRQVIVRYGLEGRKE
jgi:hypothetical protein